MGGINWKKKKKNTSLYGKKLRNAWFVVFISGEIPPSITSLGKK